MVDKLPIKNSAQLSMIIVPPIFLLVATIILPLRFWARKEKKQNWGLDDYLCLAALVVTYCEYGSMVGAVVWGGLGLPILTIPFKNISLVFKILVSLSECWATAVALIQLSILCLYVRIFSIVTWFKWTCYVLMVVVFVWWASFFVTILTACIPLKAFWTPGLKGTCIDMYKFALASTVTHIVIDILLVLLVLPIIWRMHTNSKNKFTVFIALSLALFATSCAIARLATRLHEWTNPDATGVAWIGSLLDLLENAAAVICSSLPVMAFLFTRMGQSRMGSSIRRLFSSGSSRSNLGSGSKGSSVEEGFSRPSKDPSDCESSF